MQKEFEAVKDAMDKSSGGGRDHAKAVKLAEEYVKTHTAEFAQFKDLSIEELVAAVDVFRAANMADDQWRVETYLLAKFLPQNIGGAYHPELRTPGI